MIEARFHGVIGSDAASWLWPDSRLLGGAWTRGVPVNIELADAGLVLFPRTRLLRGKRWAPVTLAWDDERTSREALLAAMAQAGFREISALPW